MIKFSCIWKGPDFILSLEDEEYGFMCYEDPKHKDRCVHGLVGNGSLDLTLEQARDLLFQISNAIEVYETLDKMSEQDCERYTQQDIGDSNENKS